MSLRRRWERFVSRLSLARVCPLLALFYFLIHLLRIFLFIPALFFFVQGRGEGGRWRRSFIQGDLEIAQKQRRNKARETDRCLFGYKCRFVEEEDRAEVLEKAK